MIDPPRPDPGGGEDAASTGASLRRLRSVAGFAIGVALLGAAGWAICAGGGEAREAWAQVRGAPSWLVASVILLPVLNWVLMSLCFWVLTRRHGRVGPGEMSALIGAAWMLNYLPLRAGMVGRIAYHRVVNRIAVGDAVRIMIANILCGSAAMGLLLVLAAALASAGVGGSWEAAPIVAGAGVVPLLAAAFLRARAMRNAAMLLLVVALRYADLLVWVARYASVFALVGSPLGLSGALAIAVVCQIALLVPFVGNGLGVREWAVGLTAAALPAGLAADGVGVGLMADLVNRAAELLPAVAVGLASSAYLGVRLRRLPRGAA